MTSTSGPFFGPGGTLESAHPSYERRPGQEEMASAVARTFGDGGHLMVEAGTGTGKTLAYLAPAIEAGRRVVVSTGTRNLQDQIFTQDLPFLRDRAGYRFRATLMKGRDNYLCIRRHDEFRRQPLFEILDESRWAPVVADWAETTVRGDRAEISELPDQLRFWRDVNARAETCTGSKCPDHEMCFLTRMKRDAERSDIVIVNHHLFFADLAIRSAFGAVLPDYDTVVFDEAHLLEEVATMFFGVQAGSGQVEELARDAERLAARDGGPSRGGGGAASLRRAAEAFWTPLRDDLEGRAGRQTFRAMNGGGLDLEPEWTAIREALAEIRRCAAPGLPGSAGESGESIERRAEDLEARLERILARDDPGHVYGMEARGRRGVVLSASPIDVSSLLRETLFERLHASVLTSASLAVDGRFAFFRDRLGLEEPDALVVESPFDHETQARLYLPRNMPEPRDASFPERACDEIESLLRITAGRAFLLFTSYAMMERIRKLLADRTDWTLFVQGEGSKVALVEAFRSTERSVLLGTMSFWHGVDVPGDALSLVVVDKLPFDVPTDPLVAARIERIRQDGGNPFRAYQTPMAVLELKQGLGRLLRRRSDRGLLAVLDPRLTTRQYGKTFLRSLPPYKVVRDVEACRRFFDGTSG